MVLYSTKSGSPVITSQEPLLVLYSTIFLECMGRFFDALNTGRFCIIYNGWQPCERNCDKIINKKSGAVQAAIRTAFIFQPKWHDNTGPRGQKNRSAHQESLPVLPISQSGPE